MGFQVGTHTENYMYTVPLSNVPFNTKETDQLQNFDHNPWMSTWFRQSNCNNFGHFRTVIDLPLRCPMMPRVSSTDHRFPGGLLIIQHSTRKQLTSSASHQPIGFFKATAGSGSPRIVGHFLSCLQWPGSTISSSIWIGHWLLPPKIRSLQTRSQKLMISIWFHRISIKLMIPYWKAHWKTHMLRLQLSAPRFDLLAPLDIHKQISVQLERNEIYISRQRERERERDRMRISIRRRRRRRRRIGQARTG